MKARKPIPQAAIAISIVMISALIMTACGAPAGTQGTLQVEMTQTEPPVPPPAETTVAPPTEVPVPTVTLPPVLAAALPYPEALKVVTEKDIPYTRPLQPGVVEQKLDVYHPEGEGPWPVVILVPPVGNYRNTLTAMSLGKKLAGQGMVVFVPDAGTEESTYNLTVAAEENGAAIREVLEEISCGLLFAQSNAREYGGNPDNLTIFGYSIGALYGLNVALQGGQLGSSWENLAAERGGPPAQTECVEQGNVEKPDAFVSYGGDYNLGLLKQVDPELAEMLDPSANVAGNPGLKVTLLYNLKRIKDDPLEYTAKLKDALAAAGLTIELFMVDAPSLSITSRGPELDWITNAILHLAEE
jgi:predicted esterase